MRTDGAIITNAGQELLSYALANNKQVNFTKVKLGKGDVNTFDEAEKLTDVVSFYKQIPITSITRNNVGIVRIRSSFTNADFPLQVVLKEIGVFAIVEGKSEILFGYVNDGEGESFPPGSSGNIVERVRDIYVGVSTNTQVTAVVDKSVIYPTIYDLEDAINAHMRDDYRRLIGSRYKGTYEHGEYLLGDVYFKDEIISVGAEVLDGSSPGLQNFVEKTLERSLKTLNGNVESPFYLNMPHSAPIAGVELESGVRIASENYTVGFSVHKDIRIVTVEVQNSADPALISSMIEDINSSPKLIEVESLYTPIHNTTEAYPSGFVY